MGATGDRHDGWFVHLSVTAEDGKAMLGVDPKSYGDHGARLESPAESDRKELVLYSREPDREHARGDVMDRYQRIRRLAELDPEPALVVSLAQAAPRRRSPGRLPHILMGEARRALDVESNFEWAVVLAQTACEAYVRDILERKAAQLGSGAIDAVDDLRGTNLANRDVRGFFTKMTGYAPPTDASWWTDYDAHAKRRHRIVHKGDRVTRADAEASMVAAKALMDFLHWPSQSVDPQRT